jgi:adenosine kinase
MLSTVDDHGNRIVTLYPGALAEAHAIELSTVPGADLVMIAPGDARAMLAHAAECRRLGLRFAVAPSPLLGSLTTDELRTLVDGADHVFTNSRNADVLLDALSWSRTELLARIGTWVVTLGADGACLETSGAAPVVIPAAPGRVEVDRQGVADAFRAGYLAGLGWRLSTVRAAQVGCLLATLALESRGSQEYRLDPDMFLKRLDEAYGPEAALEVEHKLAPSQPSEVDTTRRYHR